VTSMLRAAVKRLSDTFDSIVIARACRSPKQTAPQSAVGGGGLHVTGSFERGAVASRVRP
jgi:hypothetical protein